MQEKTPLEKNTSIYTQYLEETKNAEREAASLYDEKKWPEAQRFYEQAVSSLEKIPENDRDFGAWMKIGKYKFHIGKTYQNRQPQELKRAQKAYTDAAQIIESQKHRADLPGFWHVLGLCYTVLSEVSWTLAEWETAQTNANKGIEYLTLLHPKGDAEWRLLAYCHRILGRVYLQQHETRLARKAFFSAISNRCNVACGTEEDFLRIVEYSRLMSNRTYFNNNLKALSNLIHGTLIPNTFGNYPPVNDFFNSLNEALASASNLDKEAFSYVLLPFAQFIVSNQNNINFRNPGVSKLSSDQLNELNDLIKKLEEHADRVQSLANQSLTCVVMNQEQKIRKLERELQKKPQIAPPQPKPNEKAQSDLRRFFNPLQNIPSLETSSRKINPEKTEETAEGPPAKKMNTK